MATVPQQVFETQLRSRRKRLVEVRGHGAPEAERLLAEVDAALVRLEQGSYGICDVCHDPVEADRLLADPLARVCLDHLSALERRALERDLELAGQIQSALLPARVLRATGWHAHFKYQPYGTVSGDTCDLIAGAAPGQFRLLLGDVAGKGVAASLLMSSLQAIFRALTGAGLPLGELMQHANRLFCEGTLPNSYATVVAACATADGWVELCNAGHLPGLVVRPGQVERLPATGLPLGLFCGGDYTPTRVLLRPGELLVLFTDGLTEARNADGEEFGLERLCDILTRVPQQAGADDAVAILLNALDSFTGRAARHDDLTVLAVRRTLEH